jgi:predicted O-methyltransferase YrrM
MMTGITTKLNMRMQQTENILEAFTKLTTTIKTERFVEIGTGWGGLSVFLSLVAPVLTMDTVDRRERPDLFKKLGIDYRKWDVFEHVNTIEQIIKLDGITVVLCDGGNKPEEFKLLAPFLKPGDIIMAHDYSKDTNIWEWSEIDDTVLVGLDYLEPFMQDIFTQSAWLCRRGIG